MKKKYPIVNGNKSEGHLQDYHKNIRTFSLEESNNKTKHSTQKKRETILYKEKKNRGELKWGFN